MTLERFLGIVLQACWIAVLAVVFLGLLGAITIKPL